MGLRALVPQWVHPRPVLRAALARWALAFDPRGAFRAAGAIGRIEHALGAGPAAADVAAVFGPMPPRQAERIARGMRVSYGRSILIDEIAARGGLARVEPLIRFEDPARAAALARGGPAVLGIFHAGPVFSIAAALHRLGIDSTALRWEPMAGLPEGVEIRAVSAGAGARMVALRRACQRVRDGACIVIALDGGAGEGVGPFPFLGRQLSIMRGGPFIARFGRVPLVPILPRWEAGGARIAITIGDPIHAPDAGDAAAREHAIAAAAARFFDREVRRTPEVLFPPWLALVARLQPTAMEAAGPGRASDRGA